MFTAVRSSFAAFPRACEVPRDVRDKTGTTTCSHFSLVSLRCAWFSLMLPFPFRHFRVSLSSRLSHNRLSESCYRALSGTLRVMTTFKRSYRFLFTPERRALRRIVGTLFKHLSTYPKSYDFGREMFFPSLMLSLYKKTRTLALVVLWSLEI